MSGGGLSWPSIIRLALVQSAIGAIVVLCTATFNRVMVVEMALPASLPAGLVAWHYVIQMSRPSWGHGSDRGARRTPFIILGMGILAIGCVMAADATVSLQDSLWTGIVLGVVAFALIGAGVSAAGTSLLALMASRVSPERRPAAAAIAWVMMIAGIVVTAASAGHFLDPYSPSRLVVVASLVALIAFCVALLAVAGVEARAPSIAVEVAPQVSFAETLREIWQEDLAREFTIFVFLSMLAYSAQELIMEPFAGLVFRYSIGHSTQLAGVQQSGVLMGMIATGLAGTLVPGDRARWMRGSIVFGCAASAAALAVLALAGFSPDAYPLKAIVAALGFANGIFAVSAIGLMMAFAGNGRQSGAGVRMGVWGAAQAIAFAIGGFAGAAGLDLLRHSLGSVPLAFATVFGIEAALFAGASLFALRLGQTGSANGAAIAMGAAE